jgi:hypothetical protein
MRRIAVSLNYLLLLLLGTASMTIAQTPKAQPRPVPPAARPQKKGRVTRAHLSVTPARSTGACPATFKFNGTITTDGPAEVKYTWVSFDGGTWPEHTLTFTGAGTKPVTESRQSGAPGETKSGWMEINVLTPNSVHSNKATFVMACGRPAPKRK